MFRKANLKNNLVKYLSVPVTVRPNIIIIIKTANKIFRCKTELTFITYKSTYCYMVVLHSSAFMPSKKKGCTFIAVF